jgi:hypothetical protein
MSNTPSSTERLSEGGLLMRLMRLHSTAGAARLSAMAMQLRSTEQESSLQDAAKRDLAHVFLSPGPEPCLECELITTGLANWVHLEGSYRFEGGETFDSVCELALSLCVAESP